MEEIINIYNNGFKLFSIELENKYNLDRNKLQKEYNYIYKKKITGYMLFVKEMYNNKELNNLTISKTSKIISKKWKNLDKKTKQIYIDKANLHKNPKNIKKEIKPDKILNNNYNETLDNNILTKFIHNNKEYYIDNYNNIITVNNKLGKYVGYVQDNNYIFNK